MQRVFLPPESFVAGRALLPPDVAHYLSHVLRLRPGQEFLALDGSGAEYRARLSADSPAQAEIIERLPARSQTAVALTLYQGLPRGKRFPLIIQKATELGVARIVAVTTARSQVRLGAAEAAAKALRWQRVATEAAEQSLRPVAPELIMAQSWATALDQWRSLGQPGLLLDESLAGEAGRGVAAALQQLGRPEALAVFVGPEGGFAPEEAASARAAGVVPVGLGPRVLRTETAALVACALIMYEYGELG
jgi:16S rRNA (uracil1498-N3)-methyltransferase